MQSYQAKVEPVTVEQLSAQRFAPYGSVIDESALFYPEFDDTGEGRIAFERITMTRTPLDRHTIGFHFSYTQPVVVLNGVFGLTVASPPKNPNAGREEADLDYRTLRSFELRSGDAVLINRGVWHDFAYLSESCTILHLTRRLTADRYSSPADLINMTVRDGRVIRLKYEPLA